jgi:repressor LexA
MNMTTPLQHKIYLFITQYIKEYAYSPSLQEIAIGIGISPRSISLISRGVHALVKTGKLVFYKKGRRKIQLAPPAITSPAFILPVLGRIAAGSPIEAIQDYRAIDVGWILQGESHFVLEVKGDSMVDEGILDNDFVICKQAVKAEEGDIVVALIDQNDTTLKRFSYAVKGMVTLIPANPHLKPKAYSPHRIQIQGIFVGLLRLNNPKLCRV